MNVKRFVCIHANHNGKTSKQKIVKQLIANAGYPIYRDSSFSPNLQYSVRCQAVFVDHRQGCRNGCDTVRDVAVVLDRSNVLVQSFPPHHPVNYTKFQTAQQSINNNKQKWKDV